MLMKLQLVLFPLPIVTVLLRPLVCAVCGHMDSASVLLSEQRACSYCDDVPGYRKPQSPALS